MTSFAKNNLTNCDRLQWILTTFIAFPPCILTVSSSGKDFVVLNESSFNYMQAIVSCRKEKMELAEVKTATQISDLNNALNAKFPNIANMKFWLHMDRKGIVLLRILDRGYSSSTWLPHYTQPDFEYASSFADE